MYQIKNQDIDRELRSSGKVIRAVLPYMQESTFRKANRLMKVMKGVGARGLDYQQVWIDRGEKSETAEKLRACVYQPKEKKDSAPGLLWIHGGGYCLGAPEQEGRIIREFIAASGCTVVSPDYCLATERPYPAALLDCYAALKWMKENAQALHIRDDQLFVGGESAGGGLTAALCIYARDKGEVAVSFQIPLYPMLDDRMLTKSAQNNDAPLWNTKSNEAGWRLYLRDLYQSDHASPYAVPGRLTDFSNLPPAYTFVGDIEPFYDETVQYMEQLKLAGVPADYDIYPGCYHGFDVVRPKSTVAQKAHARLMEHFLYAAAHYRKSQPGQP